MYSRAALIDPDDIKLEPGFESDEEFFEDENDLQAIPFFRTRPATSRPRLLPMPDVYWDRNCFPDDDAVQLAEKEVSEVNFLSRLTGDQMTQFVQRLTNKAVLLDWKEQEEMTRWKKVREPEEVGEVPPEDGREEEDDEH